MAQSSLQSHLTILESSSSRFACRPAFRIPQIAQATGKVEHWKVITYQQFHDDVELVARHWIKMLRADGIPSRAIVGLWLSGWSYSDVVHIYGISRAGFIPQPFRVTLSDPDVVFELLKKAKARALICEASFEVNLDKSPVPIHKTADISSLYDVDDEPLPRLTPIVRGDDIVIVFHTSGSTSGIPKLIPCSYKWLDNVAFKTGQIAKPKDPNHPDVNTWVGSTCHISQTRLLLGSFQHGSCALQPTRMAFSSEELADMVEQCNLNRLTQFATYLGIHLRNSYSNPKLLSLLQSLDEVQYNGMSLSRQEENWAYRNGILLKNAFGSTECGLMMSSIGGRGSDASLLRPLVGVSYAFCPVDPPPSNTDPRSIGILLELVVLSNSGDCPDPSLRSSTDGHFHTGDLFEEVAPGCYISRGRNDDWIKAENGGRCDTRPIEENVLSTCSDLIAACVVVGDMRPSPALFIEPARGDIDPVKLKEDILQRTHDFHARRYRHERISSVDMIIVVDRGTLPRTATKGNIRRRAVEEAFKETLDNVYSQV